MRRRALSPTTVPLADFFLGTDLQYVPNLIPSILLIQIPFHGSGGSEIYQVTISLFEGLSTSSYLSRNPVGTPPQVLTVSIISLDQRYPLI